MTTTDFLDALREDVGVLQAQHTILANVLSRAHALVHDGHVFVEEDGHTAMVRSTTDATALDINSFTSVRMLADCVGTTEVLQ